MQQAILETALHPALAAVFLGQIVPTVQKIVMEATKKQLSDGQKVWLHVGLCLVTAAIPVCATWLTMGWPGAEAVLAAIGVVFLRSQTYFDTYFKHQREATGEAAAPGV